VTPGSFRDELLEVAPARRDAWVDHAFGLVDLPADGPALPRGCVPYLPTPVASLLQMIELAELREADVFVDIGAGVGRAAVLVHRVTGARAVGIEIQPQLVRAARELAQRLGTTQVSIVEGDAPELADALAEGTVFFFYCPFSDTRLERVLDVLATIAKARPIRLCTVDLPVPSRPWLEPVALGNQLRVYRSI
jgi:SAM-dependent methyltransferase